MFEKKTGADRGEPVAVDALARTEPINPPAPPKDLPTVYELAQSHGHIQTAPRAAKLEPRDPSTITIQDPRFAAASALHGWQSHEYHAGEPLRLSEEDYMLALEAAEKPEEDGIYRPHEKAVSKYSPHHIT